MSTYLAVSAATWGVAMALAPLLQIRAMRSNGTSAAVSVGYQQVLLVGFVLWLAYGVAIANMPLIVTNSVAAVASAATILVALSFRRTT
jgi:MtN3 and saliva related transmembrane protein